MDVLAGAVQDGKLENGEWELWKEDAVMGTNTTLMISSDVAAEVTCLQIKAQQEGNRTTLKRDDEVASNLKIHDIFREIMLGADLKCCAGCLSLYAGRLAQLAIAGLHSDVVHLNVSSMHLRVVLMTRDAADIKEVLLVNAVHFHLVTRNHYFIAVSFICAIHLEVYMLRIEYSGPRNVWSKEYYKIFYGCHKVIQSDYAIMFESEFLFGQMHEEINKTSFYFDDITLLKCFEINAIISLIRDDETKCIIWAPRIWDPWDNLFDCRD
ncbi:hypothetical protein ACJX0J_008945 [Zea mays]